jgi:D-lactate dehydrogenase (cytochrome)
MALVEAPERSKEQHKAAAAVIAALAARYGNRLVTSQALREQHGHTTTWIKNQPPDAVVFPQSAEEVQEIVRLCAAHRVPAPRSKARLMRRAAASALISAT